MTFQPPTRSAHPADAYHRAWELLEERDPRGAIALLGAGYDDRVDAIAPAITYFDLADALFPNGVFKKLWAGVFVNSGGGCGKFEAALCAMYERVAESGVPDAEVLTFVQHCVEHRLMIGTGKSWLSVATWGPGHRALWAAPEPEEKERTDLVLLPVGAVSAAPSPAAR